MSIELFYLIWSAALGFLYVNVEGGLFRAQVGLKRANGIRDDDPEPSVKVARGRRALRNFYETYPLFVALTAAVLVSDRSDVLTEWGCHLYFWARVAYLPLYVFAISPARSVIWAVSIVGLLLVFVGALF